MIAGAVIADLAAHLVFAAATLILGFIDLKEHRLPNPIVGWATGLVLTLLALAAGLGERWPVLLAAVASGLAYGLVLLVLWLITPRAIGAGDVKLAPLIGLMAGWAGVWVASIWVPLAIAALSGIAALIAYSKGAKRIAFGPVLLAACWLGIILTGVGWIA